MGWVSLEVERELPVSLDGSLSHLFEFESSSEAKWVLQEGLRAFKKRLTLNKWVLEVGHYREGVHAKES